jgi:hypothetical protein
MSGESVVRAESRASFLESENLRLQEELYMTREALAGAQNIIRQLRDKDSGIDLAVQVAPWPGYKGELQY